ncbi:MAG: ATP-binding protein [Verrucomicrobia bacterium]|nr:ATP-binding protein [Verrucomicrobiota bacterium]
MNIRRKALERVRELASRFPVVAVLGPRQCGKTTLARRGLDYPYFDLEKPSDYRVFADDPELALRSFAPPLILDEVQRLPQVFPVLRGKIDADRRKTGQYFLLGSVNPALIRDVSESLAGRVGVIELTPFLAVEVLQIGLETLWHRGGFPDAALAGSDAVWDDWQDQYVRTFVERDLARFGTRQSPVQLRDLLTMLAGQQGGLLNASSLGRALGITHHTVQSTLDLLEGHFLVRRLRPYHANVGKRLVKAPKLYVRDSGLLHHLLGVRDAEALKRTAARGNSWEGFVVENLIALELLARPSSRFWFHRTHSGSEVDLIVDRGNRRIGFEVKLAAAVGSRDAAGLIQARADGVIDEGVLLYHGERSVPLAEGVQALPAGPVLRGGLWEETGCAAVGDAPPASP